MIENMAYFKDESGGLHHPFGSTQLDSIQRYAGVGDECAFRLPIEATVVSACDEGRD